MYYMQTNRPSPGVISMNREFKGSVHSNIGSELDKGKNATFLLSKGQSAIFKAFSHCFNKNHFKLYLMCADLSS